LNKKVKVHLKIDTGTTRVGIQPSEAVDFCKQLKRFKFLELEGIWSHFASSEEDPAFTKKQHDLFALTCKNINEKGIETPVKHIACSAASISYEFTHENAIRLGLSFYGLYPDKQAKGRIVLKPALSWYTKIIQIKHYRPGPEWDTEEHFRQTAVKNRHHPVGYWDGYDRRFSNRASVLINGSRCPVVGRICMNLCMIDVTNIDAKEGDKVVLIGKSGKEYIGPMIWHNGRRRLIMKLFPESTLYCPGYLTDVMRHYKSEYTFEKYKPYESRWKRFCRSRKKKKNSAFPVQRENSRYGKNPFKSHRKKISLTTVKVLILIVLILGWSFCCFIFLFSHQQNYDLRSEQFNQ